MDIINCRVTLMYLNVWLSVETSAAIIKTDRCHLITPRPRLTPCLPTLVLSQMCNEGLEALWWRGALRCWSVPLIPTAVCWLSNNTDITWEASWGGRTPGVWLLETFGDVFSPGGPPRPSAIQECICEGGQRRGRRTQNCPFKERKGLRRGDLCALVCLTF